MTYGASKERDMVRSVLPSTRRKGARHDLRNTKQGHRASLRQELRQIGKGLYSEDVIDNYDEAAADLNFYPNAEIREIMRDRRNGDKLSAFLAWAPHQVKDVRLEDRLSKMRKMMPDDVTGRHAVSHLEWEDAFAVPHDSFRWFYYNRFRLTDEEKVWVGAVEYAAGVEMLMTVIERGLLRRFNEWPVMKTRHRVSFEEWDANRYKWRPSDEQSGRLAYGWRSNYSGDHSYVRIRGQYWRNTTVRRPLRGIHDIEAFVKEAEKESLINALQIVGVG